MPWERSPYSPHIQSSSSSCRCLSAHMQTDSSGTPPRRYPAPACPASVKAPYLVIHVLLVMVPRVAVWHHESIFLFDEPIMAPKGIIEGEDFFLAVGRIGDACGNSLLGLGGLTIQMHILEP